MYTHDTMILRHFTDESSCDLLTDHDKLPAYSWEKDLDDQETQANYVPTPSKL